MYQLCGVSRSYGLWGTWAVRFGMAGALLAFVSRARTVDVDMWHEMATFREALHAGHVLWHDVFAYTPTVEPVVHHEWGAGAVFYGLFVWGGLGSVGLMAAKYLLTLAIGAGCVVCALRRGADERLVAWMSIPAIAIGWVGFTTIRAQVFTLLFLVVLLLLIEEDRRGRRWWVAVWLPVYVAWLNIHAGFVVGVGILALYGTEQVVRTWARENSLTAALRRHRHLAAVGAGMLVLTLANPYGWKYLPYLWDAISMDRPLIAEWRPLWEHAQAPWFLFLMGLTLAAVGYAAIAKGIRRLPGLAAVLVTAYLAARHFRHVSLYGVVWICYAPAYLEDTPFGRWLVDVWSRRRQFAVAVCGLMGVLGVAAAVCNRFWEPRIPTDQAERADGVPIYPVGAVAYLAERGFSGNVMVPFSAGGYVSWKLFPDVKVSIDGRYEVAYPAGALEESAAFYAAMPGWTDTLARYPTDAVLVPRGAAVEGAMEDLDIGEGRGDSPAWRLVYRDDGYSLFVRDDIAERLPVMDRTGRRQPATFP